MKNPIKNYKFWLRIIGAALLIILGLWIILDNSFANIIVLMLTGIVALVFSVIRVVPLLRTLTNKKSKLITALEIFIHLLLGCYLIISAVNMFKDPDSKLAQFNNEYYRYFIAFLFYSRALVYFICTVLYKEDTDKAKFWTHIVIMTLACFMCSFSDITSQKLAITVAVIAFIISFTFIIESGNNYNNYRKEIIKSKNETKKIETKEDDILRLPEEEQNQINVC